MAEYHELLLPVKLKRYAGTKDSTTILHLNIRSLKCKSDNFITLLDQLCVSFEAVMLSETWYATDDDVFIVPGYNHFFLNRSGKRGGGVCIYVRQDIRCEILDAFTEITDDYEIVTVKHGRQLLSVMYRPPAGSFNNFLSFLERYLDFISLNNYSLVLGGDLNVNSSENSSLSSRLSSTLSSSGFCNVIVSPTRITHSTASCIDVFITNINTIVRSAGTISSDISDHLPIFFCFQTRDLSRSVGRLVTFQAITDCQLRSFRSTVMQTDWTSVFSKQCVNEAYDDFINIFKTLYIASFPYKTVTAKKRIRKPWVTPPILTMIRKKNRLYQEYLCSKDDGDHAVFKRYRNQLTSALKKSKTEYHKRLFHDAHKKRPAIVWQSINEVLKRSKQKNSIDELSLSGESVSGVQLSELFNRHFTNLPSSAHNEHASSFISHRVTDTIFLQPTDELEVIRVFMGLNNSKSHDIDDIQIKPVKFVIDVVAPLLVYIFNLALSSGQFPNNMKLAKVSVLHKGGDKNLVTNYRPISVLPIFSKGLEKIILYRLDNFFTKTSVLTDSQFGFRKGKSTESALISQKEIILHNIECKLLTLGIFIDLSKAFDCLNHSTLLDKLSCYGIRGTPLILIHSYLEHRKQCVSVSDHVSSLQILKFGVPQGSILGPLLFNVYINDLVNICHQARFVMYADDTSIFLSASNMDELIPMGNLVLEKFLSWSKINGLKINTVKSKAILFRPVNKHVISNYTLEIGTDQIEIVKQHKTLGVIFSEHMQWDNHIEYLVTKLSKVVGIICHCRSLLPVNIKMQIYHALFSSQINYCHLVWGTTTKSNINKLTILQKKMLRFIANVPYDTHTEPLFLKFNIMRIASVYEYRLLCSYLFSTAEFASFLSNVSHLTKRESFILVRRREFWNVPHFRTNYALQSIAHNLPSLLNKFLIDHNDIHCLTKKDVRVCFV